MYMPLLKKTRIRETEHLSTNADRSTDTTVGWTKNTQKRKKSSKTNLNITASYQYNRLISQYNRLMSLYNRLTETDPQNQQKRDDFRPLPDKNVQFWDHFFPALFPKDSESLKISDIRLREVGTKCASKYTTRKGTDTQTHRQTDRQTYGHRDY